MSGRQLRRQLLGTGLVILFAVLPALIAGSRLDAPPAPGEWQRVHQGLTGDATEQLGSAVARLFYGAMLPDEPRSLPEPSSMAGERLLAQARLAQLGGLLALGLLCYLVVLRAFGRQQALLVLIVLALLGPVLHDGQVLRPETPVAVFSLFALLFMQLLAERLQRRRGGGPRRALVAAALALTAATATALALLALPHYGVVLLVPGAAMGAILLQVSVRFLRVMRRRQWVVWPVRALLLRLWPWVLTSLLAIVVSIAVLGAGLEVTAERLRESWSAVGLLPVSPWLRWPLLLVGWLGALGLVLRVGLRFGRSPGLSPALLLSLYAAVMLIGHWLAEPGRDALPAAVPCALLLGQGVVWSVLLAAGRMRRRAVAPGGAG